MNNELHTIGFTERMNSVDRLVKLPSALTAENGAKALLIGEFYETCKIECPECHGDMDYGPCAVCHDQGSITQRVTVEWTTIKEIYQRIVENLAS